VDFNMPANAIVAGATYFFPSASKAHFGVTGGVGYYMADGSGTISLDDGVTNLTVSGDVTGNGVAGFSIATVGGAGSAPGASGAAPAPSSSTTSGY